MSASPTRRNVLWSGLAAAALPSVAWGRSPRNAYLAIHREWTRELRLYNGFFTGLLARGTLLAPEMRSAMAEERKRLYGADEADHAAWVERMRDEGSRYHEVVLAIDSSYDNADEVGGQGDDRWIVRLEKDGAQQPVVDVSHVRQPTPLQAQLFPQVDIWSELFLCRFEKKDPAPGRVVFHIGGGYGNGDMTWEAAG